MIFNTEADLAAEGVKECPTTSKALDVEKSTTYDKTKFLTFPASTSNDDEHDHEDDSGEEHDTEDCEIGEIIAKATRKEEMEVL